MVVDSINVIFLESGSKWMAVKNAQTYPSLEERLDVTTTQAFVLASSIVLNDSGKLLKKGWSYAFGRNPSPSEAYNYSIKAMEAAAWPVITPNNNAATLGHIIGELRANPYKVHTSITEKQENIGIAAVSDLMQTVREGHTDRHGTAKPVQVTQQAAEQAVLTAVMVCSLFNRGYIST